MALNGIILSEVVDNFFFLLDLPIILSALGFNKRINPLFLWPQVAAFLVCLVIVQLRLELVIYLGHVHLLLFPQIFLEEMIMILLPFRLQGGLDIDFILQRLQLVLDSHRLQVWVHFQIRICHVEELSFAPIILPFLLSIKFRGGIVNLILLGICQFVRPIHLLHESHLCHLSRLLQHPLLVLASIWEESISKATRAIVELVAGRCVFDCLLAHRELLLTELTHCEIWRSQGCIRSVIEIKLVGANHALHQCLPVTCPRKRLHGHLVHNVGWLVRHSTPAFIYSDSIGVLSDRVHAWMLGEANGCLVDGIWEIVRGGSCRGHFWVLLWLSTASATLYFSIGFDLEVLDLSCSYSWVLVLFYVILSDLLRYGLLHLLNRVLVEIVDDDRLELFRVRHGLVAGPSRSKVARSLVLRLFLMIASTVRHKLDCLRI